MHDQQQLDVYGLSLRGRAHEQNHDHFAIATLAKSIKLHQSNLAIDDESRVHGNNQGHLFLVADGISRGPAPARASGTAVDSVVQYFLNEMQWLHFGDGEPEDVTMALEDALRNAQDELLNSVKRDKAGLGTTMTLAFVFWPHLYIAHVGDSRCYLKRDGELRQLTTDHALAAVPSQPEVRHLVLRRGDVLALVTDGVTSAGSEREFEELLDARTPAEHVCGRLVQGRGDDDRTAIVARFLPHETRPAKVLVAQAPPGLDSYKQWRKPTAGSASSDTIRRTRFPLPKVAFGGVLRGVAR